MFATLRGRALARRRRPAFPKCPSSTWLVHFGALLGQTCGALPPIAFAGSDPADPDAPAPPSSYQSEISPYSSLGPAKPSGWLEQNQRAVIPSGTVAHEVNVAQAGEPSRQSNASEAGEWTCSYGYAVHEYDEYQGRH